MSPCVLITMLHDQSFHSHPYPLPNMLKKILNHIFLVNIFMKKKVKSLSRVRLFATPWTVAHQAPLSMGYSSTLAWKIPWTEEPSGLQSMGSQRVRHV